MSEACARLRSLAMAESSSSWSLGEYAVSIRSDFRSTASLPPHQPRWIRHVHNTLTTLQDAIRPYSDTAADMSRNVRHLEDEFAARHDVSVADFPRYSAYF